MDALHVAVPPKHAELTRNAARTLGIEALRELFPIMPGMRLVSDDAEELLLNRFWRPTLCVTGAAGMPPVETAGNVLRAETSFVLSVRLPPTADAKQMAEVLQKTLTRDPPYGAEVSFSVTKASPGWCAPELAPWLDTALNAASREFWAADMRAMGEGGSIPFMDMLGRRFPRAQFVITGVLGPQSNAHGPNEFLHIDEAKGVTCAVAYVVRSHFEQTRGAR
jgi:acetylornithine deacetylase/succinyl-diaminopimelate desuccinylase-like protein